MRPDGELGPPLLGGKVSGLEHLVLLDGVETGSLVEFALPRIVDSIQRSLLEAGEVIFRRSASETPGEVTTLEMLTARCTILVNVACWPSWAANAWPSHRTSQRSARLRHVLRARYRSPAVGSAP